MKLCLPYLIICFLLLTSCQKEKEIDGLVVDPWYAFFNPEPYETEILKMSPETLMIENNSLILSSQISIVKSTNLNSYPIEQLSCSSQIKDINGLPITNVFSLEQYVILNDSVWQGKVGPYPDSIIFTQQFMLNRTTPDVAPKWRESLYVDVVVLLGKDSSRYYIQKKNQLVTRLQ